MKVLLNLNERVMLFDLLNTDPAFKEGSVGTWRQLVAAKDVLGISEADLKTFKVDDKGIADKELAAKEHEYQLPDSLYALIVSYLKAENDKGKLTERLFRIWEKLVKDDVSK